MSARGSQRPRRRGPVAFDCGSRPGAGASRCTLERRISAAGPPPFTQVQWPSGRGLRRRTPRRGFHGPLSCPSDSERAGRKARGDSERTGGWGLVGGGCGRVHDQEAGTGRAPICGARKAQAPKWNQTSTFVTTQATVTLRRWPLPARPCTSNTGSLLEDCGLRIRITPRAKMSSNQQ